MISKLLNFFRREPRKLVLIRRISSRVTMSEWRQDKEFVISARKFLGDPNFLVILDVLKNESPGNWTLDAGRCSLEERAVMQARNEGYQLCLNNLERLGIYEQAKQPLEPTFEQDDD